MNYALLFDLISMIGTISAVGFGMRNILKSNEQTEQIQLKNNIEMKKDLSHISDNQLKLTEKIDEFSSLQNETITKVSVLEEKIKNSNIRIENLEKEMKKK